MQNSALKKKKGFKLRTLWQAGVVMAGFYQLGWAAVVPNKVTINEVYTNKDGTIPNSATAKNLRISLYKTGSTTSFWEADFDKVSLQAGGEFWVVLNKSNNLDDLPSFTEPFWYEVTDRDDSHKAVALKPFTSSPYAVYANKAIEADHATVATHADDGVPKDAIIIWILTAQNPVIPPYVLDQYYVVQEFPGCFPRLGSAAEPYGIGGSESHRHNVSGDTRENIGMTLTPLGTGITPIAFPIPDKHSHSLDLDTNSVKTLPPYVDIVFLRKK